MIKQKLSLAISIALTTGTLQAQTFKIENSEKFKYPFRQIVKTLAFSDDQFHYYSTKKTNDKRVRIGFTRVPQIGSGMQGSLLGAGVMALSMMKKREDYNIYMQKVDRKNLTLGRSFEIDMAVVEGSKKSKNNVQGAEFFRQGDEILVLGTRQNTKEDKYQLYAKSVDLDGKEIKPWALILETPVRKVEEENMYSLERFDDNSIVAYINPSDKKENETYIRYVIDKDFKVVSQKKAIFPVKDKNNSLLYNVFSGNYMASICFSDKRFFLRRFDFSKSDSIQDDKVFLGDDQNDLFSLSYAWVPETKSIFVAGGYRKPKTNQALADGFFVSKLNYEKMKVEFLEFNPFTNGFGKQSSGKIMWGGRSDDQFAHFESSWLRTNADGSFTFSFRSLLTEYNMRTRQNVYGAYGIIQSKINASGKAEWMTYLPQKAASYDYSDVVAFSRVNPRGETEYFYLGREGDLTATKADEAGDKGKPIMIYAKIDDKGERTMKEVYKLKELKAFKKLDPGDFESVGDNEIDFVFYPSGSSIMLGRLLIQY